MPWITQCIQSITIVPEEVIGNNFEIVNMASGKKIGRLRDGYKSSNFILSSIDNWWTFFQSMTIQNYIPIRIATSK